MNILNDKFKGEGIEMFMPPENKKNETKYKIVSDMEIYEKFVDLLKNKVDSDQIISEVDSNESYEIFLECLFEKTSTSLTHLSILM